jgi:hypothetical protein
MKERAWSVADPRRFDVSGMPYLLMQVRHFLNRMITDMIIHFLWRASSTGPDF